MRVWLLAVLAVGIVSVLAYELWPQKLARGQVFTLACHPLDDSPIDIDCNFIKQ